MAYTRILGKQVGAEEKSTNQYCIVAILIILGLGWFTPNLSFAEPSTNKQNLFPLDYPSRKVEHHTNISTFHHDSRIKLFSNADLQSEKLEYTPILPTLNPRFKSAQRPFSHSSQPTKSLLIDVFFDSRHQLLTGNSSRAIQEIAEILDEHPYWELHIENFCDSRGSTAYNIVLGERNNQRIFEFFTNLGIPEYRLHTLSSGRNAQWCAPTSATCQAQNLWLKNGFEVMSPKQTELGCTARISTFTTNPKDNLKLPNRSLTFLQPLHLADTWNHKSYSDL